MMVSLLSNTENIECMNKFYEVVLIQLVNLSFKIVSYFSKFLKENFYHLLFYLTQRNGWLMQEKFSSIMYC